MKILDRFRLDEKKVLITGGGQGLGKAYAQALAEAGADVAIVDINEDTAKEVAKEVSRLGGRSLSIRADVRLKSDAYAMVEEVVSRWGRLDIAINNAGLSEIVEAINISESNWDSIMGLDLKGTFFCAQAEARSMMRNKYGKIINISSIAAHMAYFCNNVVPQFQIAYSVAKAGVVHLTRCLAAEWAKYGIRINCISPGFVCTPAVMEKRFETIRSKWVEYTPLGKLGQVEDLQGAVIYLSSEVSDFMTGCDLVIDGGFLTMK